jgi:transcriptional accessory protein Tex/SPT6
MVYPNCHPTYNERHEKIIEMINWTLEKYKANKKNTQQNKQEVIIDDIIKELAKKRGIARHEKKQAMLKDEVSSMYRLKEDTIICSFQNS